MSDDAQQPNEILSANLPVEHAETVAPELIEHDQLEDVADDVANDDVANEVVTNELLGDVGEVDEVLSDDSEIDSEDDSTPYDYDELDEDEQEVVVAPPQVREAIWGKGDRKKKKNRADTDTAGESEEHEFDGDNDPSPIPRAREHSGPAKFAPQRLAKILAAAGINARRKCEEFVTAGRVTVDGQVITDMAFRADPYSQKIELDGEKIKLQRKVYFILNKPRGVV